MYTCICSLTVGFNIAFGLRFQCMMSSILILIICSDLEIDLEIVDNQLNLEIKMVNNSFAELQVENCLLIFCERPTVDTDLGMLLWKALLTFLTNLNLWLMFDIFREFTMPSPAIKVNHRTPANLGTSCTYTNTVYGRNLDTITTHWKGKSHLRCFVISFD